MTLYLINQCKPNNFATKTAQAISNVDWLMPNMHQKPMLAKDMVVLEALDQMFAKPHWLQRELIALHQLSMDLQSSFRHFKPALTVVIHYSLHMIKFKMKS